MSGDHVMTKLTNWPERQAAAYRNGADRPLGGYLRAMSVYAVGTAGAYLAARRGGRPIPRPTPWDVAQLTVATHKVSRVIAKSPVTSPIRAPFTAYDGLSAPSELHEEVRGHGTRHAVGELLTCPMCLAQWVAGHRLQHRPRIRTCGHPAGALHVHRCRRCGLPPARIRQVAAGNTVTVRTPDIR
jgi:hypothetical protein